MTSDKLIVLGVTLAFAVGGWMALGLFGIATEAPIRAGSAWLVGAVGPYGMLAVIVGAFLALHFLQKAFQRRHEARQFAADRTIHVQSPREREAFQRGLGLQAAIALGGVILIGLVLTLFKV